MDKRGKIKHLNVQYFIVLLIEYYYCKYTYMNSRQIQKKKLKTIGHNLVTVDRVVALKTMALKSIVVPKFPKHFLGQQQFAP